MGLCFSHGGACWAFSGFNKFRERLGEAIGVDLKKMRGFTKPPEAGISWDTVNDPIKDLLNHSDCDGELTPGQCAIIAPQLKKIVSDWEDTDYDKQQALKLVDGMEDAIARAENFEFR